MVRCRHCDREINMDDTSYWVHTHSDMVGCGNGETQAEPDSEPNGPSDAELTAAMADLLG